MPDKKRFLKKVNVNFISLVDKGANRKTIIFKAAHTNLPEGEAYNKTISISKYNDEQQIVYGIVYSPDEVDTDGDFTSADVIKQMAYDFMKNRNTNNVDHQHDYNPDEGYIAESWLLEKNDPRFPGEREGSWAVGIKVTNHETWSKVKSGEITGLSMAGVAVVEEIHEEKNSLQDSMITKISRIIKDGIGVLIKDFQNNKSNINKNKGNAMTPEEITNVIKSHITEALKPFGDLEKAINELKNLFESKSGEIEKRLELIEDISPGSSQVITKEEIFKKDQNYKGPTWLS